jgi:hypothetical protein
MTYLESSISEGEVPHSSTKTFIFGICPLLAMYLFAASKQCFTI